MNNMNSVKFNYEDFKNGKIAVKCKTQEIYDKFLEDWEEKILPFCGV